MAESSSKKSLPKPRNRNPPSMSKEDLLQRLQKFGVESGRDLLMVDLRKDDYEGGTIRGSLNLPIESLYHTLPTLLELCKNANVKFVIFYCGSCMGRGPKAAGWLDDLLSDMSVGDVQSMFLQGGIKGWATAGKEYTDLMDEYDAAYWEKSTHPMKLSSPVVRNADSPRVDSSYSRTHLTLRNYQGPRLLKTIRGRPELATGITTIPLVSERPAMASLSNDPIMALPQSSDEEEDDQYQSDASKGHSDNSSNAKRKVDAREEQLPSKKRRTKVEVKSTRTSQRNTKPIASQGELEPAPGTEDNILEFPDFLSQSSQPRKQQRAKFGKTDVYNPSSSQGTLFADPGELPSTPRKSKGSLFKVVDTPPSSRKRTPGQKTKALEVPSSAKKIKETAIKFNVPEEIGLPISSSTSTELSTGFDAIDPLKATSRKRTSSTSSLSSVDSIASYELNHTQKKELGNGTTPLEPVPAGHIRCPLCLRAVKVANLPSRIEPTNMSLRKQQTFCLSHRLKDAQIEWQAKDYPTIDWTLLEKKRIGKYIPHLRQILYRKAPSFYLDSLEAKVQEAKGNQSKIRQYLASDIVEVVKPGYYGPKGAKIMGNAITAEMSHHLKRSLKTDKTVRAVGISGFVSAVLLPELLQQIVMEDMKSDSEADARRIINESTEAGMLLWPDDDHVVQEEEI